MDLSKITIKDIHSLFKVKVMSGEKRIITDRRFSGFVFSPNGKFIYSQNGADYLSDPQHVLFLPEGATYELKCLTEDECPLVNFMCGTEIKDIIEFEVGSSAGFIKSYDELDRLFNFKSAFYYHKCMSGIYDMLLKLQTASVFAGKQKYDCLKPAVHFMEANYSSVGLSNESIAKKANISTVYFRKMFREMYGMPPMAYIRQVRIEKAKNMLKSGFSSIEYVGSSVGYASVYHFSRAFKLATGFTPTEYAHYCMS